MAAAAGSGMYDSTLASARRGTTARFVDAHTK
jgi:hypothetical protein